MAADYATDPSAFADAIKAVLTNEATGLSRPITDVTFRWGTHRTRLARQSPGAGGDEPTAQVHLGLPSPHGATPMSIAGNYRIEDTPLVIEVLYHLAGGDDLDDDDRGGGSLFGLGKVALRDASKLIEALTYPGNLRFTPAGAATGLVGASLRRGTEALESQEDEEGGRFIVRLAFRAWVMIAQGV